MKDFFQLQCEIIWIDEFSSMSQTYEWQKIVKVTASFGEISTSCGSRVNV